MKTSLHSLIPFLPVFLNHLRLPSQGTQSQSQNQSYVTTDGQSASLSWNKASIWGLRPDLHYCQTVACLFDVWRSLWREDGSVVYNCSWSSPAQSFSGPSPIGLVTIFYCLRFHTSLFVASYDLQGYGGGIRPRLHTGFKGLSQLFSLYSLGADQQEIPFPSLSQKYLSYCLIVRCRRNVFTEMLPSNERLLWLYYSGFQASCHNMFKSPP
jgi:hypothetical protein